MRLLIISKNIGMMRGGGATRTISFASGLAERGVDVGVVYARPWFGEVRHPVEGSFATYTVRSPYLRDISYRLPKGRGVVPRLDDRLFAKRVVAEIGHALPCPDVFLTFGNFPLAAKLKERFGRPVVVSSAGGLPSGNVRSAVRAVDAVIGDGAELPAFEKAFGVSVVEIRKGVDTQHFRPPERREPLGGRTIRLVWSGRLAPVKNVPMALRVVERLVDRGVEVSLVVLGAGSLLGPLTRQAEALGIAGRVEFAGHVRREYLPQRYRDADAFILTSTFDNFPNAILEAMASGLPVVATRVGGVPDQVRDGINGHLVPSEDDAAMADAIQEIVSRPELLGDMGRRNREDAERRYDWSVSIDRLHELCVDLADPGGAHLETAREGQARKLVP